MALPKEIIFATGNQNKLKEVQAMFPSSTKILTLKDIGFDQDIEETGTTIEANSLLKAETIFKKYGKPVFAEDTGLEVDALGGEPGVYSARYAGEPGSSEANMDKLLLNLKEKEDRKAQFKTIATFLSGDTSIIVEGIVRGEILEEREGEDGFGYDPIFRAAGFRNSFAQMTNLEKNLISHRGIAIKKLLKKLTEYYK